jgi:ABC-2 type transport system ATP-binding protein
MIEVSNLTKMYGQKAAVNNVSFKIDDGEIVGFLGPNGAGKTTTMNILTGYLSATSGKAQVDGVDILEDPITVKKKIGYLPEQPPLYMDMTVKEYLNFIFDLKKVKIDRQSHIKEICDLVKITDVYNRIIKNLSKGYRQRVGIAQALIGNPQVLILDEPTVGLDPNQIIEIRNLIKKLGKKHTVILSSHILSEVQAVCDRIIVINRGNLIADGTADSLSKDLSGDHRLVIRVDGAENDVYNILSKINGVVKVEKLGRKETGSFDFTVESEPGRDLRREISKRLAERGCAILMFKSNELTLEDIFIKLTIGEGV